MVLRRAKRHGLRSNNTIKYNCYDIPSYWGTSQPHEIVGENVELRQTQFEDSKRKHCTKRYAVKRTWTNDGCPLSMNRYKRWELPDAIITDDKTKLQKFAYELEKLGWSNALEDGRVPVQNIIAEVDYCRKDGRQYNNNNLFTKEHYFIDYEADTESEKDDEEIDTVKVVKRQRIIRIKHESLKGNKSTIAKRKHLCAHEGERISTKKETTNKTEKKVKRRKKRSKEEYYRMKTQDCWVDYVGRDRTHPSFQRDEAEISPGWYHGGDGSSKSYYKIKGRKNKETKRYYDDQVNPTFVQRL
jgi:hypothetical protein